MNMISVEKVIFEATSPDSQEKYQAVVGLEISFLSLNDDTFTTNRARNFPRKPSL